MATCRGVLQACLVLWALTACGDDPRAARRLAAIDVSGPWQDVNGGGALVDIAQENGITDVVIEVRERRLFDAETALIARMSDESVRRAVAESITLGSGPDLERIEGDGGENVSFDDGATTTVQVVGPGLAVASTPGARDAIIRWSMHLTGDSDGLSGTLTVASLELRTAPTEIDGVALSATTSSQPIEIVPVR